MTAAVVFAVAWNAVALVLGIIGIFRRAARPALARAANFQASAAVATALVCAVTGILGSLFGLTGAIGLFFAWLFWAVGGLLPFTVAIFLLARPRGEASADSVKEAGRLTGQ